MDSFRYTFSLRCFHPDMQAEKISKLVNLEPWISQSVGEIRRTPKGGILEGRYSRSYCCFELSEGPDDTFFPELRKWNIFLGEKKEGLANFRQTGGTLEYFVGFFLNHNAGIELFPEFSADLAELGIRLSLDIYPPDICPVKDE